MDHLLYPFTIPVRLAYYVFLLFILYGCKLENEKRIVKDAIKNVWRR